MTVTCKHGTEVYKFRCPECADEEKERSMTDTRADVATDAVRSVCDDPKIADDEFCFTKGTMKSVLTELAASEKERDGIRAMLYEVLQWNPADESMIALYSDEQKRTRRIVVDAAIATLDAKGESKAGDVE